MFFTETWRPDSFYDRIAANRRAGLHTLCLLDIKVKEPSLEALARGKTVYEPARCAAWHSIWCMLSHHAGTRYRWSLWQQTCVP